MLSMHISDEAFQLATQYHLGEPIRVYRTDKRPHLKLFGWATAITYLIIIIVVFIQTPFRFTHTTIFLYTIVFAIMVIVALLWLIPLLCIRKTTVYVCSAGFLLHHRATERVVRWEEVEWVLSDNGRCIIYLAKKQRVILGQLIGHLEMLAQEIEIKARLVRRPEGREHLEEQFEHLLNKQAVNLREREERLLENKALIEKETTAEALRLQEAYRLGDFIATYHGGFKGIFRKQAIRLPIYYLLLLSFPLLLIGSIFHFFPVGLFLASNCEILFPVLLLLSSFFMPRFFARFLRLHVYSDGFVSLDSNFFEVVHWEQIEKVMYHKTMPLLSPPLCHIYLTNGETMVINGYIHEQRTIKQIFDEHVAKKGEAG